MRTHYLAIITVTWLLVAGCGRQEKEYPAKSPLPVTVMELRKQTPSSGRVYAGAVRSWKTEDISFEVNGRVTWVVEPGMEIEGRAYNPEGKLLSPGTQIAQLDDERFSSALAAAKSQMEIATLQRDSVQVQIDSGMPAEITSAQSELRLANSELERNQRLVSQGAGSPKALDQAKTNAEAAKSRLDGLNAKFRQTQSELKSAEASIRAAEQAVADAERNLSDTKLFSAFRGVVANVFVVPGSLAGASTKVATIQMMNPIKIELEVSAAMSRKVQVNDKIAIQITTPDNRNETIEATVYTISPSADNATRTFTLALLARNRKLETKLPEGTKRNDFAQAQFLWQLDLGIMPETDEGVFYMPEIGMFKDAQGDFVWRLDEVKIGDAIPKVLSASKLYVRAGNVSLPFLGKRRFRTIEVLPNQDFDPTSDMFAAGIEVPGGEVAAWSGEQLLLDDGATWALRPGDLVNVNLSGDARAAGLYVPAEAIHEDAGRTFIFVVEKGEAGSKVRRLEVEQPSERTQVSSLHRVESNSEDLEGKQIVVDGVHYLTDGAAVNVVEVLESVQ